MARKKTDVLSLSLEDMKRIVSESGLRHIAFIMDGNGRWARRRALPREAGHGVGTKTFKKTVTLCRDYGIATVTTYAFSTENWKRPQKRSEKHFHMQRSKHFKSVSRS